MNRLSWFFGYFLFAMILISCNQTKDRTHSTNTITVDSTEQIAERFAEVEKISPRNFTIDSTNSYSTLFLDSIRLTEYLAKAAVPKMVADRMKSFYNSRNYQFAWFTHGGPTEQGRSFWNMYSYFSANESDRVLRDSALRAQMRILIDDTTSSVWRSSNQNLANVEMNLSRQFITYALKHYEQWFEDGTELESFVPAKKTNPLKQAQEVLDKQGNFEINKEYVALRNQLKKYMQIYNSGGWPKINEVPKDTIVGAKSESIPALKKRLFLSEDLANQDTSNLFTNDLKEAIKKFQLRHGYKQTGKLSALQLKDMNVSVEERIQQIVMNLERAKWLVTEPQGKMISVNIPEFILRVREGNKEVMEMNVVVGKEGNRTTMFTGNLNQVVFSPYWNVPFGISKNEIAPGIRRSGNAYLTRQNMEVVGSWGNGIPRVRQRPGGNNALGKVKFLFPNSYDIYFHDTPSKSLFKNDKRAYSHGCIRLSQPKALAQYLLKEDTTYTEKVIDSLMNMTKEKNVKLKKSVPVLITYYTAWVDENGLLHFADDIYKHDKSLFAKMFEPNPTAIEKTVEVKIDSVKPKPIVKKDSVIKPVEKPKLPVQDSSNNIITDSITKPKE